MSYPEGVCEFDPRAPWNQVPTYENEVCGHCLDVAEIRRLDGSTLYSCSATDPLEEVKFDSEACCLFRR